MTRAALRWLFVGQGTMGAAALGELAAAAAPVGVVTAEPALGEPPVAATARAHDLALVHAERVGDDPARRWPGLAGDLDAVVCACWTEHLTPAALSLARHGWLNLHPSALPAWRGADPVGWQLLTAPARLGVTVHRMTPEPDAGPVVATGSVAVAAGDDRGAVLGRSGARLGRLAAGVLADLAAGAAPAEQPQDEDEATWCPPPGVVALVDPRALRAAAAARATRAFSPEPGVSVATLAAGQRVAVAGGQPDGPLGPQLGEGEAPGDVAHGRDGTVAVACTDRWLRGWLVGSGEPATGGPAADAPSRVELAAPGTTRLPRGGS